VITFEMALDEIRSLPNCDRDFLFEQAQQIPISCSRYRPFAASPTTFTPERS
jgi:hypothetical protein